MIPAHLSAILTHIGLTSYHRPDVVIQSATKRDIEGQKVRQVKERQNQDGFIQIFGTNSPNLQTNLVYHVINISQRLRSNMNKDASHKQS